MAESFKIRVLDLVSELLAHTFCVFRALKAAWAIATRAFKAFLYEADGFLVWIERDFHGVPFGVDALLCCQWRCGRFPKKSRRTCLMSEDVVANR